MIISRTPVRVSLGGGGTDLPSYAGKHGGFVISGAIDKYQFITVSRRRLDRLIRASYSQTEIVRSVDALEHNLIREALRLTRLEGGLEITSVADVPGNSGLGGSGSFTVGLLTALHALKRETVTIDDLVEEACRIEIDILGEPIGKQDQYIAGYGGIRCLEIAHDGSVTVSSLKLRDHVVDELERNLLLFYTGLGRNASDVLVHQDRASKADEPAVVDQLHRIKAIGLQMKAALESGEVSRVGALLDDHWNAKRGLSSKVTNSRIDRWYELARANGARGGKIMGAGGGGFFMLYVDENKEGLRAVMTAEGLVEMRFRFEPEGTKVLLDV